MNYKFQIIFDFMLRLSISIKFKGGGINGF